MIAEEMSQVSCHQYIAGGELETVRSALVQRLRVNTIPYWEADPQDRPAHLGPGSLFELYSPHWLRVGWIELEPVDPSQVLVRVGLPAFPDARDVELLEDRIREAIPPPAVALRLMDMDGDFARITATLARHLHEFRLQRLQEIRTTLAGCLGWIAVNGVVLERRRIAEPEAAPQTSSDQVEAVRDIPASVGTLREDQQELLRLWQAGHTAKEIALRTSRTEKTILNQLTLLRKAYGEALVPRRR